MTSHLPWFKRIFMPNPANISLWFIIVFFFFDDFVLRFFWNSILNTSLGIIYDVNLFLWAIFIYAGGSLAVYATKRTYKGNRKLFVLLIVIFSLLVGLDQPIVNSTINRPVYYCDVDADCAMKVVSDARVCEKYTCVNTGWNHYEGLLPSVFASCLLPHKICACRENLCVDGLEVVTDQAVCSGILQFRFKDRCYSNLAKNTNDDSYCQSVSSESGRQDCYAQFNAKKET